MFQSARYSRLFASDGKCFDLALDHGFFNEFSLSSGLEDMRHSVETGIEIGVDAVQVTPGQAYHLQTVPGRQKPSLVLRVDTANVYGPQRPQYLFSQLIDSPVEQALRWDAACVILNILYWPQEGGLHRQCLANLSALVAEGQRWHMPVMVEPLVLSQGSGGSLESVGDVNLLCALVRQTVEMGADIIKCDPTSDAADFQRVVEAACGRPVLARGGGRISEIGILERTRALMDEGAAGVVYGRNITQHPRPRAIGRAVMALVHEAATVDRAKELLTRY